MISALCRGRVGRRVGRRGAFCPLSGTRQEVLLHVMLAWDTPKRCSRASHPARATHPGRRVGRRQASRLSGDTSGDLPGDYPACNARLGHTKKCSRDDSTSPRDPPGPRLVRRPTHRGRGGRPMLVPARRPTRGGSLQEPIPGRRSHTPPLTLIRKCGVLYILPDIVQRGGRESPTPRPTPSVHS